MNKNEHSIILDNLIIDTCFLHDLSLYTGKMGISIFFYRYGKCMDNSLYTNFANELVDEIYEDIDDNIPVKFENGLAGIGWGIDYLFKNSFVEGNVNDVLVSIDDKITSYIFSSEKIEDKDLIGFLHYIICRVNVYGSSFLKNNILNICCELIDGLYESKTKSILLKMINDPMKYDRENTLKQIVMHSSKNSFHLKK